LRASSLAFLALATDGLVMPLTLLLPATLGPLLAAFAFAALAAATTLSKLPLLGFLLRPTFLTVAPPTNVARSLSTRFKNGLGRFSSSEKSYSGGGGDDCGAEVVLFAVVAATDAEGRFALDEDTVFRGDGNPVGSEVDAGRPGR